MEIHAPPEKIGMVAALGIESFFLCGPGRWRRANEMKFRILRPDSGGELLCTCCGTGAESAYKASVRLIEMGATVLAVVGISGGLDPDLVAGDVLVADSVTYQKHGEKIEKWITDPGISMGVFRSILSRRIGVKQGSIITLDRPAGQKEEKINLFRQTGASAADLESAGIARAAAENGVPFIALRSICDSACRDLDPYVLSCLKRNGNIGFVQLLRGIISHPAVVKNLFELSLDFARSITSLRRGWLCCVKPGVLL